jgi:hypothetical protein
VAQKPYSDLGRLIVEVSRSHTVRYTTLGRTSLDEGSARRWDLYLTTRDIHKRQISMPPVGFDPALPASERPHTSALDRAIYSYNPKNFLINDGIFEETENKGCGVKHSVRQIYRTTLTLYSEETVKINLSYRIRVKVRYMYKTIQIFHGKLKLFCWMEKSGCGVF